MSFRVLVLCVLVLASGCNGSGSSPSSPAPSRESVGVPAPTADPLQELRGIMQAGQKTIPSEKRSTFVSASIDVVKTSSLVVPYVGQILSDWNDGTSGGLVVVYFKYENGRWTPVWANRGARGGFFPGALREGKALLTEDGFSRRDIPAEMIYPWSPRATYRIKVWDPSAL